MDTWARGYSPLSNSASNHSFNHSATANLYIAIGVADAGVQCPPTPSFIVWNGASTGVNFTEIRCLSNGISTFEEFYYAGTINASWNIAEYHAYGTSITSSFVVTSWENANVSVVPTATAEDYHNSCDHTTNTTTALSPTLNNEKVMSAIILIACTSATYVQNFGGSGDNPIGLTGIGNGNCWPFGGIGSRCIGVGLIGNGATSDNFYYPLNPDALRVQFGIRFKGAPIRPAVVTTNPATNVQYTYANLNGELTDLGSSINITVGFLFGKNATLTSNVTNITVGYMLHTGTFTHLVNSLNSSTTFYFLAWANSSDGFSVGAIRSFTTLTNFIDSLYNGFILLLFVTVLVLFFMACFWIRKHRGLVQ
jgi:hypothetical protein